MTALDPARIDWRVSNTWDKGSEKWGMLVAYIDARTAMEQLDALDEKWTSRMEPIDLNGQVGIRCTLTVNGVSREDVGVPSNTEPLKGAFSDALKRAAVHFGIGRELYEMPKIGVLCEVGANGKVKGPKALPTYHNGRWDIDRKLGWIRYDQEPPREQEQPPKRRTAPQSEARARLQAIVLLNNISHDRLEELGREVGIPAGEHGTDEQYEQIIALIEQPQAAVPGTPAATDTPDEREQPLGGQAGAVTPVPADVETPAGDAQSETDAVIPPDGDAPAAPSIEDVLAVTGGELIEDVPEHGTQAYRDWFEKQPREKRQALRAQKLGPSDKPKRRTAPDPEPMTAGLA